MTDRGKIAVLLLVLGAGLAIVGSFEATVAAMLTLRGRTAFVGRIMAMGAAGALGGIVLAYWMQIRHEIEITSNWPDQGGPMARVDLLGGMYLLAAGAVVGLVGAALAQRKQEVRQEEPEEEVVVHQLDSDDDTPPFGIAITDERQEAR